MELRLSRIKICSQESNLEKSDWSWVSNVEEIV